MRGVVLKAGATALTVAVAAGSAAYVSHNVKDAAAPLRPPVVGAAANASRGGKLSLTPSIRSADVRAVTSTYAS